MRDASIAQPREIAHAPVVAAWVPIECDCGKIVAEMSSDRHWLRYLCRDRLHGGKVYSYIDLRKQPRDGKIVAAGHLRLECDHG